MTDTTTTSIWTNESATVATTTTKLAEVKSPWTDDNAEDGQENPMESTKIDFRSCPDDAYNSDSDDDDNDLIFQDMQLFFHAIGEPQLIDRFLANKVTLGQLLEFDEQDLINCGVELVGERKRILSNTAQMHAERWSPSSLQDLTGKSLLSSPGFYIALNDINKHLEYIGITFAYLKRSIQRDATILELGKDYVGVGKISSELKDIVKTSNSTYARLQSLDRHVEKYLDAPTLQPANHIDKKYLRKAEFKQRLNSTLLIGVPICLALMFSIKRSLY